MISSKKIKFIFKHLLEALLLYYLAFLTVDVFLGGAISHFFKAGIVMALALLIAIGLSYFYPKNSQKKATKKEQKEAYKIFIGFLIFFGIILFKAFINHDLMVAIFLGIISPVLIYLNKDYFLE